jgi:alpha-tubulin suppressor-like RCC1 family protein
VQTTESLKSISPGRRHTCGVGKSGTAYCWGGGLDGTLGTGTTDHQLLPTAVAGAISFKAVAAGELRTCGLSKEGKAYCWGWSQYGGLGIGPLEADEVFPEPMEVQTDKRFTSIDVGAATCALTQEGKAFCWGINWWGNVGNGTTEHQSLPVPVSTTERFEALSLAGHSCGLTGGGELWCWGSSGDGKLGVGSQENTRVPQKVKTTERFSQVTAGQFHTCATTTAGALFCWGSNAAGQLGDGGVSLGWDLPVLTWRW